MSIKEFSINDLMAEVTQRVSAIIPSNNTQATRYLGVPTSEHIDKINSFLSTKTEPEDWFVCLIYSSDNLVNRSQEKWSINILKAMEKRSNGTLLLLDHDWFEVKSSVGFIFDSFLAENQSPPSQQAIGHEEDNKKIIGKEGYFCLFNWVAIPKNQEIVSAINERRSQYVSTGGFVNKTRLICPICTEEKGREIGVYDLNDEGKYICPHSLPGYGWWDDSEEMEMPYVIWDGDYDPIEVSIVNSPNLPAAEICR